MDPTPEGMIQAAIALGPWPSAALKALLREAEVKDWQIVGAAKLLVERGELVRVRQTFWVSPEFRESNCGAPLYIEGHSRAELIRRLGPPAPSASAHTAIESVMQGDDAERLAAQAYANEVESWRG